MDHRHQRHRDGVGVGVAAGYAARRVRQLRAARAARLSRARLAAAAAATGSAARLPGVAAARIVSAASMAMSTVARLPAAMAAEAVGRAGSQRVRRPVAARVNKVLPMAVARAMVARWVASRAPPGGPA